MAEEESKEKLRKWTLYLQLIFAFAALVVLGSCVGEIDSLGGGHNTNQKMVGIFFFHLFLLVPCLFGLLVYLQVKLEKYLLSTKEIDQLNEVRMVHARAEAKTMLGPLYALFKPHSENNDEKK